MGSRGTEQRQQGRQGFLGFEVGKCMCLAQLPGSMDKWFGYAWVLMSVRPCPPPSGDGTLAARARVSVPDRIGRLKIEYRGFVGGLSPSDAGTWPSMPSGPSLGPETLRGGCSASRRQFRTLMRFE